MSDLDNNVKDKLAALAAEREAKREASQAQQVIEDIPELSETPNTPEAEAAPIPAEKVVDEKAEEASTTTPEVETPEPSEEDEIKFDWEVDTSAEAPSSLDLKKIGSALNLEVTNEEDFVKTVNEKFTKLKEYEERITKDDSLPLEFKQTFDEIKDIASKGGDWQSAVFASLGNVANLNPLDLFDQQYERMNGHKFKKEDGSYDRDALFAEIDSIPEGMREMQGNQEKQRLMQIQEQRKQSVQQQLKQTYENFNSKLSEAVKSAAESFPKDKWGITLEPQHLTAIKEGIANGKLVQKHLGNIDVSMLSKFDADKLMKTVIKAEISEKAAQFNYKKGKSDGKRELLDKTQNPQIETPGKIVAPDVSDDKKQKTTADQIKEMMLRSKPANSL